MKITGEAFNGAMRATYSISMCLAYFSLKGKIVLFPVVESGHYDLVVDDVGLKRIQCKYTSSLRQNSKVPTLSLSANHIKRERYSADSFDLLWITTQERNYLIPIDVISRNGVVISGLALNRNYNKYIVKIDYPAPLPSSRKSGGHLSKDECATITDYLGQGIPGAQIARLMNISESTVARFKSGFTHRPHYMKSRKVKLEE